MRQCPNSLSTRAQDAFRWWYEFHEFRILPFSGFDFAGQPAFVTQAIRIGESEFRSIEPVSPTARSQRQMLEELAAEAHRRTLQ